MFYFTCNESKIYESFTFWNKLQEKKLNDILIYWDAPVDTLTWQNGAITTRFKLEKLHAKLGTGWNRLEFEEPMVAVWQSLVTLVARDVKSTRK